MSEPTSEVRSKLFQNLQQVQTRISRACAESNRSPTDVRLVAVTKYTAESLVEEFLRLGYMDLGENRPQQLLERASRLPGSVSWHLIGQLQRNKVRSILPRVTLIHSIDSLKLLQHVSRIAGELQRIPRLLLQVNVSGEASKNGLTPQELQRAANEFGALPDVNIVGLMTMAPEGANETELRATFGGLRELKDQLNQADIGLSLTELSMGMSGDFEIAIQEGATLIRLGSVLFHECEPMR